MTTDTNAPRQRSSLDRVTEGISFRVRIAAALTRLKLKYFVTRKEVVVDYGWAKLPFTNDGDLQEAIYHGHARVWHQKELAALSPWISKGASIVDVGANL